MDGKTVAKRSLARELLLLIVPITLQNLISAAVNAADVVMLAEWDRTRCRRCRRSVR